MIKDLDRDIYTIKYNVLNLPDVIQFKNGNQIKNLYDADGHKLQSNYYTRITTLPVPIVENQVATDVTSTNDYLLTGTDYVNNFEYSFSNDGGDYQHDLDKIYNDEGYVQNPANPQYFYFRHDHLGDNREVWLANTNTTVQRTQYYPSGLPWAYDRTLDHPDLQHRKYNGKEFIEMHGYDTYDYGSRGYYPAASNFTTMDPLAEKYFSISPYAYCDRNPIIYIDPNGQEKIISFAPTKENQNQILAAKKYKSEDIIIDLFAHGNSNAIEVYDSKTKELIIINNTKDFENFLTENSSVWRNRGNKIITIVLHSCETGNEEDGNKNSFARLRSKDLRNTKIIAPDQMNCENTDTHETIGSYKVNVVDKDKNLYTLGAKGYWITFQRGKSTNVESGDSKPGDSKPKSNNNIGFWSKVIKLLY